MITYTCCNLLHHSVIVLLSVTIMSLSDCPFIDAGIGVGGGVGLDHSESKDRSEGRSRWIGSIREESEHYNEEEFDESFTNQENNSINSSQYNEKSNKKGLLKSFSQRDREARAVERNERKEKRTRKINIEKSKNGNYSIGKFNTDSNDTEYSTIYARRAPLTSPGPGKGAAQNSDRMNYDNNTSQYSQLTQDSGINFGDSFYSNVEDADVDYVDSPTPKHLQGSGGNSSWSTSTGIPLNDVGSSSSKDVKKSAAEYESSRGSNKSNNSSSRSKRQIESGIEDQMNSLSNKSVPSSYTSSKDLMSNSQGFLSKNDDNNESSTYNENDDIHSNSMTKNSENIKRAANLRREEIKEEKRRLRKLTNRRSTAIPWSLLVIPKRF